MAFPKEYIIHPIQTVYLNHDEPMVDVGGEWATQSEAEESAQRATDKRGEKYGVWKLVSYTTQGPPSAVVNAVA